MGAFANAQIGIDSIIVEKYYISNAADAAGSVGTLPVGSVTYRVFVDMKATYSLQALFGKPAADNVTSLHPLKVFTSTSFFNNEDRGDTSPNSIPSNQLNKNTIALDSWFAFSGTSNNQVGVLKSDDNGAANLIQTGRSGASAGMLANTNYAMGIPLTTQDGMIPGTPGSVGFVGTGGQESIFAASSQAGNSFIVNDGSVYYQGSIAGPNPTGTNRILIGQFTTNGVFSFELNLQIKDTNGVVQNCVARNLDALATNPVQYTHPSLIYTSSTTNVNVAPTVSITAPTDAATYSVGSSVTITAAASDSDGVIDSVQFFVDGVKIGVDATSPYSYVWVTTSGTHTLTAVATDNNGEHTTSAPITISPTTGINEITANTSISIYPNPASDIVNIEINTTEQIVNATYAIYDVIGNMVSNKKIGTLSGTYSDKIDVSTFAKGLYIIKISSNGGLASTKKIIIQ